MTLTIFIIWTNEYSLEFAGNTYTLYLAHGNLEDASAIYDPLYWSDAIELHTTQHF